MSKQRAVVAIPCDVKTVGLHPFHAVGEKYIEAIAHGAGCTPILLPALGSGRDLGSMLEEIDLAGLVGGFDGIFLTGSPSNVDPSIYERERVFSDDKLDSQRDSTTLRLISAAVDHGVPLLGICRGIQEMNVAFGGTLHQAVHEVDGYIDHREDHSQPREAQYAPVHPIQLAADGVLSSMTDRDTHQVNSLHGQGIDRLGEHLVVEAKAPDGLIEAVRVETATDFAIGIQWHAEWRYWDDPLASQLFTTFGDAARARAKRRRTI